MSLRCSLNSDNIGLCDLVEHKGSMWKQFPPTTCIAPLTGAIKLGRPPTTFDNTPLELQWGWIENITVCGQYSSSLTSDVFFFCCLKVNR